MLDISPKGPAGHGAIQNEPDGTRVLFYPNDSGAGTFNGTFDGPLGGYDLRATFGSEAITIARVPVTPLMTPCRVWILTRRPEITVRS